MATLVILGVSTAVYVPYHLTAPHGPRGGSFLGLTFGIIGSIFMVYAGLLGGRKRVPVWRVGKAQTWMRGHLWLGLVSLPLILFHAGWKFGCMLTQVLMWMFIIVWASGVVGAALQHFLPRLMTTQVPMESIYEEIDGVRAKLREEADKIVASICDPLGISEPGTATQTAAPAQNLSATQVGAPMGVTVIEVEKEAGVRLRDFYHSEVRPFLDAPGAGRRLLLADAKRAEPVFRQLKTLLPPAFHDAVDDLDSICEEERQLSRQVRLHRWMHTWLLVHIPLSLALLLLGAIHAVMALRF